MRPGKNDYNEYYETYISKVKENNPLTAMEHQLNETEEFFSSFDNNDAAMPYAPGKWTYKEAFGHMIDTERIMAYRALCISRGEAKPLPGFDQDNYVAAGSFNRRDISDLLSEYSSVRKSNIIMFRSFNNDELNRRGIANNNEVTVLALAYIIAGHDKHHLEILKSYYSRKL